MVSTTSAIKNDILKKKKIESIFIEDAQLEGPSVQQNTTGVKNCTTGLVEELVQLQDSIDTQLENLTRLHEKFRMYQWNVLFIYI